MLKLCLLLLCLILVNNFLQSVCDSQLLEQYTEGNQLTDDNATISDSQEIQKNTFLPPAFVLNLDRSKDRWTKFQQELLRVNFHAERLPAVDGRALSLEELRNVSTSMAMFFQPRGVIGCYLSHRKFWQIVVDRDLPSAIIFEDDVRLIDNFEAELQRHLLEVQELKTPFDVAFLGAIGCVDPEGNDSLATRMFAAYMGGKRPFIKFSDGHYQPSRPAGTHAYLVTNAGAKKLLSLCNKAVFHVDLDAWRHRDLKLIAFSPMLAFQTFDSTELTDFNVADKKEDKSTELSRSLAPSSSLVSVLVGKNDKLNSIYNKMHDQLETITLEKTTKQPVSCIKITFDLGRLILINFIVISCSCGAIDSARTKRFDHNSAKTSCCCLLRLCDCWNSTISWPQKVFINCYGFCGIIFQFSATYHLVANELEIKSD